MIKKPWTNASGDLVAGIYAEMSDAEYQELDAVRWSTLKSALQSPLKLRHDIDTPRKDSTAFRVGRAVHILTLQPDEFAATVTVADESMQTDNGTLRNTKAAREWLAGLSADVTPITPGELATVEAMANAVVGHTACAKILADAPQREVTALWYEYTMSGKAVACKARADMLGASVIADLKTTAQIGGFSLRGIATAIARYNYHGQFGWYSRGFAKAGGQSGAGDVMRETWAWAFVDKNAPHDVVAAYADEAMIDEGIATALDAWDAYAKAIDCGEWPGIAPEAVTVSLPNWAFRNESTEDMGLEGLS